MDTQVEFKTDLNNILDRIKSMLVEKNEKYGDAALNPNQTFSSCDVLELINVRIDDKLSRIRNGAGKDDEDPEWDLLGYLVLKQIAKLRIRFAELNATSKLPS